MRLAEASPQDRLFVLVEGGAAGVLEDDVGERVAAAEAVAVPEGTVGAHKTVAGAQGLLGDQVPADAAGGAA